MALVKVAAAIIIKGDEVLIAQRPLDKHKGGYWEFPGGKIEDGESADSALIREIKEELDLTISCPKLFHTISFDYPVKSVQLYFYLVESFSGIPKGMEGQPLVWVKRKNLTKYQFPEANQVIVEKLTSSQVV